jgi:hypothetical protein
MVARGMDGSSLDPCESAKIRGKKNFKINAAQASHLGRIARERDANRFHHVKRRIVNRETALPKERSFSGTPCRQSIGEY